MDKQSENITTDLAAEKQGIACLALFGLTEALIAPPSQSVFDAAWRIIFTDSNELRKIAKMMDIDFETLQKNTRAYLSKMGVCCEKKNCH